MSKRELIESLDKEVSDIPDQAPPPWSGEPSSSLAPQPSNTRAQFACLSIHRSDLIRMFDFPPETVGLLRNTVTAHWPRQIKSEETSPPEFKLHGRPWEGQFKDAVYARRLMLRLLEALYNAGWMLTTSTCISKRQDMDLDSLIFRSQQPPPPPVDWMCISFSKSNEVRFIDAPQDVVNAFMTAIGASGGEASKITKHRPHDVPGCIRIEFDDSLWFTYSTTTGHKAKRVLLVLMGVLDAHGWSVYGSVNQKATGNESKSETDTWHCTRSKTWDPSLPVYHG